MFESYFDPGPAQPLRDTVAGIYQWSTTRWLEGGFSNLIIWIIGVLGILVLTKITYRLILWIATRVHGVGAAFYLPIGYHWIAGLITLGLVGWLICVCALPFDVLRADFARGLWFVFALALLAGAAWIWMFKPGAAGNLKAVGATFAFLALAVWAARMGGMRGVAWVGHVSLIGVWLATPIVCVLSSVREAKRIRMLLMENQQLHAVGS